MKTMDVRCPVCGTVNKGLDLVETDGWMECENCSCLIRVPDSAKGRTGKIIMSDASGRIEIHSMQAAG